MLFRSFYFISEGEGTGEEVVYQKDTVTIKTSFTKKGELMNYIHRNSFNEQLLSHIVTTRKYMKDIN